ncbi:MAG: copper resistance protein CopC [Dehalococcoidia bacterium]
MTRLLRPIIMFALAAAGLLITVGSVSGHADYDRSTPGRNEIVAQPPTRVDVYFLQDVRKLEGSNFVRVSNDGGDQVSTGDGIVDDNDRRHISAEIPTQLPAGRYVVQWMSLSDEDGDSDTGTFCFYVDTTPTNEQLAECAQFDVEQGAPTTTPGTGGPAPTEPPAEPPTATPPPAATATSEPQVTPTAVAPKDDGGGSNAGLIVGVIIGGVVVVGAIAGGVYWLRRRST